MSKHTPKTTQLLFAPHQHCNEFKSSVHRDSMVLLYKVVSHKSVLQSLGILAVAMYRKSRQILYQAIMVCDEIDFPVVNVPVMCSIIPVICLNNYPSPSHATVYLHITFDFQTDNTHHTISIEFN